jgi:hypothetical protein
VKPEVGQRRENDPEVSSPIRGKESGNILNENPSSIPENKVRDSGGLEEQSGAFACESCPFSGDGEVLAGEPSADEVNSAGGPLPIFRVGERFTSTVAF